ncbi:duf803 domain membrane [Chlorella sorokiniana]|uniref:Duf803 domain membrane n=1 Tax=Chlorella sorokiniana TaxID=3076 RepID=A0A2P6TK64_CHLSO|nr:duf803 domain membrane [Chlorella sorokiniana]|eukprot:PRW44469.1 duf803 domain membrane [Chlorella sorokiniana]
MAPADKPEQPAQQAAAAPEELQRASSKRANEAVDSAEVQGREQALRRDKPPSFKVMGRMVMAMKRFSNSLNPTYTYGKRPTSSTSSGSRRATGQEGEGPVTSRPTSPEEKDKYAFPDHGHRMAYLLKPLPPTEDEEA